MVHVTQRQFQTIMRAYQIGMLALMFGLIFFFGIVQGKGIETVFCMAAFLTLKAVYPLKLHSKSMASCFIISVVLFAALTRLSLPLSHSLVCAPILGCLTAYGATKVAEHLKSVKELQGRLKEQEAFDINSCTEEQLRARCRLKGMSAEQTDLALKFFVQKLCAKEIAAELCIDPASVDRRKSRMKKKLIS